MSGDDGLIFGAGNGLNWSSLVKSIVDSPGLVVSKPERSLETLVIMRPTISIVPPRSVSSVLPGSDVPISLLLLA